MIAGYLLHNGSKLLVLSGKSGKRFMCYDSSWYPAPSSLQDIVRDQVQASLKHGCILEGPTPNELFLFHFNQNAYLRIHLVTHHVTQLPAPLHCTIPPSAGSLGEKCFL